MENSEHKGELETPKRCEGNCKETHGKHSGIPKGVIVAGPQFIATKFIYCQNAIEEDRNNGFTVKEIDL